MEQNRAGAARSAAVWPANVDSRYREGRKSPLEREMSADFMTAGSALGGQIIITPEGLEYVTPEALENRRKAEKEKEERERARAEARKRERRQARRQFTAYVLCVALLGAIVGAAITAGVYYLKERSGTGEPPYGTRDGKRITESGEPSAEYAVGGFTPLACGLSDELQEFTYYMCESYYIDFDFVLALMFTESAFDVSAVSPTRDYGLMQINEGNAEMLNAAIGITDISEPYQNIRAGLDILRGLFEKYDDEARVCMAYNMGEYGASLLWEKGVYETGYTNKVLSKAEEYRAERSGKA